MSTLADFRNAVSRAVATQDGGDSDDEVEALYEAVAIAAELLNVEVPLAFTP